MTDIAHLIAGISMSNKDDDKNAGDPASGAVVCRRERCAQHERW
jgi:hypothetical protein